MTGSPLVRLNPWYPGQMGVRGAWTDTGLRQHCTGTIFYVDPNFPGAHDGRDGTDPTAPLLTVDAAIGRCQGYRGDVIAVMANNNWFYDNRGSAAIGYNTAITETATLDVPGVRLMGLCPSGLTGVPWQAPDSANAINVTAMNCTIEGFNFQGDSGVNAIEATWGGADYGESLTVRNCIFDSEWAVAILMSYNWHTDIHHNWFLSPTIGVSNDDAALACKYVHVHDNWFFNCSANAVYIGEGEYWKVYENQIWNSSAAQGNAAADEMIEVTTGDFNHVHHNTLSCLLPVPANGDYDDCCTAGASDVWSQNFCLDGPSVTNPA